VLEGPSTAWWHLASEQPPAGPLSQDLSDHPDDVRRVARQALAEDGPADVTTEVIGVVGQGVGTISSRERTLVAGLPYAAEVAAQAGCQAEWLVGDGDLVFEPRALGTLRGALPALLRTERPLLNLLQRACGIATATRRFVDAVAGTGCRILHTRKTAPGLRVFDVMAVVAGGGHVHRLGLDRVVMVKDNHWRALEAGSTALGAVVAESRRRGYAAVQIEVESETQVELACMAGADRLLIDNKTVEEFTALAGLARRRSPHIEIEATGGIALDNVRAYAEAGADFVSVGALTHSVQAVDLTLDLVQT